MRKIKIILTLFVTTFLISCGETKPTDDFKTALDDALESRIQQQKKDNFIIPDSLDKSLIVAVYYEMHTTEGHSLIVYNDTSKKAATLITYLIDNTVVTDQLHPIKYNEFKSISDNSLYLIKEDVVAYSHQNDNHAVAFDNPRIDKTLINR